MPVAPTLPSLNPNLKGNYHIDVFSILILTVFFRVFSYSQVKTDDQNRENKNRDEIIRVDSKLVVVPVTVLDRDGRLISNLSKQDFDLFEDGAEQEIAIFDPIERPFTIFFLLDTSGSMNSGLSDLARAANAFLRQLRPNDQITIAEFDDKVDVLCEPTSVKDARENKKFRLRVKGSAPITMVYSSVDYALKRMKKISGRKAIVLFSDGVGSGDRGAIRRSLQKAAESESLVYTVQFNTYPKIAPPLVDKEEYYKKIEIANKYMRDLAGLSGGRYYNIDEISDLEKAFSAVASELSQQYTLGYYPKQLTPGRKRITVKVHQPNAVVRARDSYDVSENN